MLKEKNTIGVLVTDKEAWLKVANDPVYGPQLKRLYNLMKSNKDTYLRLEENLSSDAHDNLMDAYKDIKEADRVKSYKDNNQGENKKTWSKTCFVAGTKVLMSDYREKNIEDIRTGDTILCVDITNMEINKDVCA